MHYESSAKTCSVLKFVSMDPFSIKMQRPGLLYSNLCLLFAAYLEELVRTMVMVMFLSLYVPLLSYCIPIRWKGVERTVWETPVNNDIVKIPLLFMLGFLFIMQQYLQIWFMLCSSMFYLYHKIGSRNHKKNLEIRFARSSWKGELYRDIHCLKVLLQKRKALTMRIKFNCPILHQVVLNLTEQ